MRDKSGQTIKTRWNNLDAQEIEVPVLASEFEEESRLRGID